MDEDFGACTSVKREGTQVFHGKKHLERRTAGRGLPPTISSRSVFEVSNRTRYLSTEHVPPSRDILGITLTSPFGPLNRMFESHALLHSWIVVKSERPLRLSRTLGGGQLHHYRQMRANRDQQGVE